MPMKMITLKLPPELLEEINYCAARRGMTRSEFIRFACSQYIDLFCREKPRVRVIHNEDEREGKD